jgi:hypothetical protein
VDAVGSLTMRRMLISVMVPASMRSLPLGVVEVRGSGRVPEDVLGCRKGAGWWAPVHCPLASGLARRGSCSRSSFCRIGLEGL